MAVFLRAQIFAFCRGHGHPLAGIQVFVSQSRPPGQLIGVFVPRCVRFLLRRDTMTRCFIPDEGAAMGRGSCP